MGGGYGTMVTIYVFEHGSEDYDQFAASVAFGAVRRGRGVTADVGVR
jgi:hypothetical protein